MTYIVEEPLWEVTLEEADRSYYKLVLIVGPAGSGKTDRLKTISESYAFGFLNLGEELSRRLLVIPPHLRSAEAEELTIDLVNEIGSLRIAIDNTEILFEPPLRLNPLAVLKKLSRSQVVVATWTGSFDKSKLTYGFQGHPAYREYAFTDEDSFIITPSQILP